MSTFLKKQISKKTDDKRLIRLAQSGDTQAFEILVKRYQQKIFSLAWKIVGNGIDAEDVAQEVFVRLYRFLPQFKRNKQFFTWLYRIVINASYDFLRAKARYRIVSLEEIPRHSYSAAYENIDSIGEVEEKVFEIIETLSTPEKTAFILREVEDLPCKEIARIMGCSNGTVRSYLHYARKHLKKLIEKHYPEFLDGFMS